MNLLLQAIAEEKLQDALELIRQGKGLEEKDEKGWNPLIYAAYYGQQALIAPLVAAGADLNYRDKSGNTALLLALRFRRDQLGAYLIAQGGHDFSLRDEMNIPALIYTIRNHLPRSLNALLAQGVKPAGSTIMHPLLETVNHVERGQMDLIEPLVEAGADLNFQDAHGRTALQLALGFGYTQAAAYLMKMGADCQIKDHQGADALDYACQYGRMPLLEALLKDTSQRPGFPTSLCRVWPQGNYALLQPDPVHPAYWQVKYQAKNRKTCLDKLNSELGAPKAPTDPYLLLLRLSEAEVTQGEMPETFPQDFEVSVGKPLILKPLPDRLQTEVYPVQAHQNPTPVHIPRVYLAGIQSAKNENDSPPFFTQVDMLFYAHDGGLYQCETLYFQAEKWRLSQAIELF